MKIKTNRNFLTENLKLLKIVSSNNISGETYRNIAIVQNDDCLEIVANDTMDIMRIKLKRSKDIDFDDFDLHLIIDPVKLLDFINNSSENDVEISIKDSSVVVKSGKSKYKVPLNEDVKYILTEASIGEQVSTNIYLSDFFESIKETSFCVSKDESRFQISSLLIEKEDNTIVFAGTDGKRMALSKITHNKDVFFKALVPKKLVGTLVTVANSSKSNEGNLLFGESSITLKILEEEREISIRGQLSQGKFPNYKQIIPESSKFKIEFDSNELFLSLNQVKAVLDKTDQGRCQFLFEGDTLKVTSSKGDGETELTYSGECNLEIYFNIEFILEMLRNSSLNRVRFELEDDGSCVVGTISEKTNYYVMPVGK